MDEMLALNWSWKIPQSSDDKELQKNVNFSNMNNVIYCHINEIEPIHSLNLDSDDDTDDNCDSNVIIDPRTKREIYNLVIDYSKSKITDNYVLLLSKLPKSFLTIDEHQSCLRFIDYMQTHYHYALSEQINVNNLTQNERLDFQTFQNCQEKRLQEKNSYLEFIYSRFFTTYIERYRNVSPNVQRFLIEKWKYDINNIELIKKTPNNNYYLLRSAIALQYDSQADIHVKMIASEEKSFKCGIVPKFNNKCLLTTYFQKSYNYSQYFNEQFLNQLSSNTLLQFDKNLSKLSDNFDISITELALIKFLDSMSCTTDWHMEIYIKELNEYKKHIFIENPLPAQLTHLERQRLGYKYLILSGICRPNSKKSYSLDKDCSVQMLNGNEWMNTNYEDTRRFYGNNYKMYKFDEYLIRYYKMHKNINVTNKLNKNYTYTNWILGNPDVKQNDFVNLTIRTEYDGCLLNDDKYEFINLSIKLEFQIEYGAEQMTKSELICEWCRQFIKPNSITQRIRIDAVTGQIINFKYLKLTDIENELYYLYKIKPNLLLQNLWGLLKTLNTFPSDQYLLKHELKNNNNVMVYNKCDEGTANAINLDEIYKNIIFEKPNIENIEWNPIDDLVILDVHHQTKTLPCSLSPYNNNVCIGSGGSIVRDLVFNDRQHVIKKSLKKLEAKKNLQKDRDNKRDQIRRLVRKCRIRKEKLNKKKEEELKSMF